MDMQLVGQLVEEVRAGKYDGKKAVVKTVLNKWVVVEANKGGYYDYFLNEYYAQFANKISKISDELAEAMLIVSMFPNKNKEEV
jgi:hypothetical protein